MKNRFPRRQELIVLIAISLLCTAVVGVSVKYAVGLAVLGAPVFLMAALMGFRRRSAATSAATEATSGSAANDPAN